MNDYQRRYLRNKYKNEKNEKPFIYIIQSNPKPIKIITQQQSNQKANKKDKQNNLYYQKPIQEEQKLNYPKNVVQKRGQYTKRNPSSLNTTTHQQNKEIIKNKYKVNSQNQNIMTNMGVEELKTMKSYAQIQSQKKENKIISNNKFGSVISRAIINRTLPSNVKPSKYSNGTIGLLNIGNTCYLNSALQNLKNIFPLTLYLLSNYSDFDRNGFAFKYCELISNLINQDTYQYFQPREFFIKLNDVAPIFRFGQQNDSSFSILYILNLLEKETRKYLGPKMFKEFKMNDSFIEEEKKKFNEFIQKLYQKRNSFIIDIFYGLQEDKYICKNKNCNYTNYSFQGISVLNLSIMTFNNTKIDSLENAIEYYEYGQYHYNEEDFFCSKCKGNRIITQSIIISLPKFLIINFKRIGENNYYNHKVEIPNDLKIKNKLDNTDYEYELIGFIKHLGGADSGHNISICKNFFDNIWYQYNDSKVFSCHNSVYYNYYTNEIDTSNAFLFFYKKKDVNITEEEINIIINNSADLRK